MMSSDTEMFQSHEETAIASLLADDKGDELTDLLVESLYEALRILVEETASETLH